MMPTCDNDSSGDHDTEFVGDTVVCNTCGRRTCRWCGNRLEDYEEGVAPCDGANHPVS